MMPITLQELHADTFAPYIQAEFQVLDDLPVQVALQLVEVHGRSQLPHQEIFTLVFHGPGSYFIPQGIHKLKHSVLGEIDLFLVPVGQDPQGFQYEAVFNRLISK